MKAREIILIVVAAVAVAIAVYSFKREVKERVVTKIEYRTMPEEKKFAKIPKKTIPAPKQIVVIEKEAIAQEMDTVFEADDQVVSNADIPPSDGGTSVVTVLNMETGQSKTFAKEKPESLFSLRNDLEVGVRYGVSTENGQEGQIFSRWQFLRVGECKLGVYGEISSDPETTAMVELVFSPTR